jgi:hypothetical protein
LKGVIWNEFFYYSNFVNLFRVWLPVCQLFLLLNIQLTTVPSLSMVQTIFSKGVAKSLVSGTREVHYIGVHLRCASNDNDRHRR